MTDDLKTIAENLGKFRGDDLIARIEAASEGSRELDEAICEEAGIPLTYSGQASAMTGKPEHFPPMPYTTSIDAAFTLPPAWDWELEYDTDGENCEAVCRMGDPMLRIDGEAATPALAVCAARLRARRWEASQ